MPAILIKDVATRLHAWLKEEAARNRRSMTQQAVVVLESTMNRPQPLHFPPFIPLNGKPLTLHEIDQTKKEGRA